MGAVLAICLEAEVKRHDLFIAIAGVHSLLPDGLIEVRLQSGAGLCRDLSLRFAASKEQKSGHPER